MQEPRGADRTYRRSTFRGWIRVLIVIVIVLALAAATFGEALEIFRPGPPVESPLSLFGSS